MTKLQKNIFLLSLFVSTAYASHQPTYPLFDVIRKCNDIETLKKLLFDEKMDLNQNGYTPLMLAVHRGHTEAVKLLLDLGVDVNAQDKEDKTALSYLKINSLDNLSTVIYLVKNTHILSIEHNHSLLKEDYLNVIFEKSYNNDEHGQDIKQYIDILLVNKIRNSIEEIKEEKRKIKLKTNLYQACYDAYIPKKVRECLVEGYVRIYFEPLERELPTDLIKLIKKHIWHPKLDTYLGFLQTAGCAEDRFLFKVTKQEENYEAVATEHFASGLVEHSIIQDTKQVINRPVFMIIPLFLTALKKLGN